MILQVTVHPLLYSVTIEMLWKSHGKGLELSISSFKIMPNNPITVKAANYVSTE